MIVPAILSRDMTKATKWVCAQSDQSSLFAWRNLGSLATHWVHAPADLSLRWAHTHLVDFVMSWLNYDGHVVAQLWWSCRGSIMMVMSWLNYDGHVVAQLWWVMSWLNYDGHVVAQLWWFLHFRDRRLWVKRLYEIIIMACLKPPQITRLLHLRSMCRYSETWWRFISVDFGQLAAGNIEHIGL